MTAIQRRELISELSLLYRRAARGYRDVRLRLIKLRNAVRQEMKRGNAERAEAYAQTAADQALVCSVYLSELRQMRHEFVLLLVSSHK